MSDFFRADGPFFHVLTVLINMIYLTALFFLCCLPIFTIGASMCAMYYTTNKVIRHDRSYVGKEFFHAFKSNFKQATPVWLVMLVIYAVLSVETYLMYQYAVNGASFGRVYIVLMIVIAVLIVYTVYVFAYMSRFENTTKNILKNAAIFATGDFLKSFLLFVLLVFFMLLIVSWPVLALALPAIYTVAANFMIEKVFRKYMTEEQIAEEFERNREFKN